VQAEVNVESARLEQEDVESTLDPPRSRGQITAISIGVIVRARRPSTISRTTRSAPRSAATDAALEELHAYHQQSNLWELLPPDVLPALTALRARGLKLTVVSNANGRLSALLDRLRVASCFDCVLDSHDEGVEKPDPRFFEIALERSGARPETTIHVGDLYQVDVLGARSAGLRGVLLDQAGLYEEVDCPRVRSLSGLVDEIARGAFD